MYRCPGRKRRIASAIVSRILAYIWQECKCPRMGLALLHRLRQSSESQNTLDGEKKMLRLAGADCLRATVLKRWGCKVKQRGDDGKDYLLSFLCPTCGEEALEVCVYKDLAPYGGGFWDVQCRSECGHIDGEYTIFNDSGLIMRNQRGEVVMIDHLNSSPPHRPFWYRILFNEEKNNTNPIILHEDENDPSPRVLFEVLWQAVNATRSDAQLVAAMRK
jgi:hypothetical protein